MMVSIMKNAHSKLDKEGLSIEQDTQVLMRWNKKSIIFSGRVA